jgi:hypothetical protein
LAYSKVAFLTNGDFHGPVCTGRLLSSGNAHTFFLILFTGLFFVNTVAILYTYNILAGPAIDARSQSIALKFIVVTTQTSRV